MKKHITILLILISSYTYSQNNLYKPIQKEAYNSYVRIEYQDNIINVWQNKDDSYSGEVIKHRDWYCEKIWGTQRDTIVIYYPISSVNSQKIINLTKELRIDTITDTNETWLQYKFTFLLHDSIIEKQFNAIQESNTNKMTIVNYYDSISKIIDLPLITYDFKKHFPKYGNTNSTGDFVYQISGYTIIGYNYICDAPLGFYIQKYFQGTKKISLGTSIGTLYNKSSNYSDIDFNINKRIVFGSNNKFLFLDCSYRNRNFIQENNTYTFYNIASSINRLRTGVIMKNNDVGLELGYSIFVPKNLARLNINVFAESDIYSHDFDYITGITSYYKNIFTKIYYENFENKNYINFSIGKDLKI